LSRTVPIDDWLRARLPSQAYTLAPASADASFRRYFRIHSAGQSCILMDAPPEHEDCRPFVAVAKLFSAAGVHVPQVLAEDFDNGYLLLSDLGTTTYLQALNDESADSLYRAANDALVKVQLVSRRGVLPDYERALLLRELRLFPDWYIAKHLGLALDPAQNRVLDQTFDLILDNNLSQSRVYVHRDYHSRNLMVSEPNPGILDFQDAVYGPITYDLVSLYKDAYIAWSEERVLDWVARYWEAARQAGLPVHSDFGEFYRDFEWMGVQRHIKVLGIFARLFYRDGKDGYLRDMPLVMAYLRSACARYTELTPLLRLLDQLEQRKPASGYTF
jgi:aminoglycoside/choline kinase family phosphotransferase